MFGKQKKKRLWGEISNAWGFNQTLVSDQNFTKKIKQEKEKEGILREISPLEVEIILSLYFL